jgi:hypothetical protein
MIAPALLRGRDRYERTMEGWTDNTHADALTHTVRLRDPDRAVELAAVCTTSPDYAIREARGRVLGGAVDPAVAEAMARLAGLRMVAGFTRRAAEVAGGGAGAAFMVDAAVEVARLARQVTKVPRERAERAAGDPRLCWELDTTAWVDLPDSCFTYSAAGRALFGTRPVTTPMHPDLYSPRPGQTRVFVRRKVARLERHDGRLRLFHAMHDDVHGFELHLEVDPVSGRIVQAEHQTPRLPYMGICSEPQRNLAALVGETVDEGLRKRIGPLIGGPGGCAQLYDLTADLLRLVLT